MANLLCLRSSVKNIKLFSYFSIRPYSISRFRPNSQTEQAFRAKDKVSNEYSIIYRAPMENYLTATNYITSVTIGLIGIMVGTGQIEIFDTNDSINIETIAGLSSSGSDAIYFFIGFILINLAIRILIHKYPLRIYKNVDRYIAVYQGQIPYKNRKIEFAKGEVTLTKPFFLNPWRDCMYELKKTRSLLMEQYFKTPSELHEMMKK